MVGTTLTFLCRKFHTYSNILISVPWLKRTISSMSMHWYNCYMYLCFNLASDLMKQMSLNTFSYIKG